MEITCCNLSFVRLGCHLQSMLFYFIIALFAVEMRLAKDVLGT